jgi:hypothetical protein
MTNYIADDTDLDFPKSDRRPLVSNESASKFITAANWNTLCQALDDVKTQMRSATHDVKSYGAAGDDSTDDSAAIRLAIAAAAASGGGVVFFPKGTYKVSQDGANFYCLNIPDGITLRGAGRSQTTIKQVASTAVSVRLLHVAGDDVVVGDLTLDGNKSGQTTNEQRHGIFATSCERLVVERVTAQNFTGDGFYLYTNANNSTFRECFATANDRNGLTFGATSSGCRLLGSRFYNNAVQQVDSEPGAGNIVSDVLITGCVIDVGASNDYALTVSGNNSNDNSRASRWSVVNNVINGGVNVVWARDITIANNTGVNSTTQAGITVYRKSSRVSVTGNTIRNTQTSTINVHGIDVLGAGTGDAPERVVVANNVVSVSHASAFGIQASGAISVTIANNECEGAGSAASLYAGICVRATNTAEAFRSAVIVGNTVRNFGNIGIRVSGNSTAALESVNISHNILDDDAGSMTVGIRLYDSGTTAASRITLIGNRCMGGVTTPVQNIPSGTPILVGGSPECGAIYSVSGTPEGALSAPVGSTAIRRDGSSGTTTYVKESGTGNTGWVAK